MNTTVGELYLIESVKSFQGLKSNAEKAMEQISDLQFHEHPDEESNNVAIIFLPVTERNLTETETVNLSTNLLPEKK